MLKSRKRLEDGKHEIFTKLSILYIFYGVPWNFEQ